MSHAFRCALGSTFGHQGGRNSVASPCVQPGLKPVQLDGGLGCVAMLRALDGGELAAGPLLGSAVVCGADTTSAQAEAAPADLVGGLQEQRRQPRSADVSGMYAVDCLPLTHNRLLVAAHPSGLVLMRRCTSVACAKFTVAFRGNFMLHICL